MIDMASKDRNPWNKNPGKRKLTERDVLKIRQSNKNNKELAKLFQVTATNIWHIKNRKTWKHIA